MFYLKRNPNRYTHEHFHAENDKTNVNSELLQPYTIVVAAADALLEIGTAISSSVLSLDVHLSLADDSCVPKLC
jgi:hypothetical protein